MAEFSWDTQSAWNTAQNRDQVVTADVGVRVADEIWQGFDPQDPPYNTLTSYWTLDETSGSTAVDEIGSNDGSINGPTIGYTGVLSSNAYNFDGSSDDVATTFSPPSDGVATLAYWVNFDSLSGDQACGLNDVNSTDATGTTNARFYAGAWGGSTQELIIGFGTNSTTVTDSSLSTGTWHHIAMTGDGSTARLYLDGTEIASITYSFGSTSMGVNIGSRNYPGGPSRYIDGQISDVMAATRALSASEIQHIYETGSAGSLTTARTQSDGSAISIHTRATIPSSTSASVTLYQDTDGNGTADHQQTISISSGSWTRSLSAFEPVIGSEYWAEIDLQSSAISASPQIDALTITAEEAAVDGMLAETTTETLIGDATPGIAGSDPGSVTDSTTATLTAGPFDTVETESAVTWTETFDAVASGLTGAEYTITDYLSEGDLLDPVLARLDEDDATILFPPGTYQLASFTTKANNIQLIAPDGDVTIEVVGSGSTMLQLSGDAWRLRGFEFDFRGRDACPKQIRAAGSGWSIVDCVWRGEMNWQSAHPSQAIAAQVDYARGEGRIRGCYFHEGAGDGYGRAIQVLPDSIGTVQVQYSWFEGWAEPAIDAREGFGPLSVSDCFIRNTVGGIRLNGPAQVMSSVFVCDGPLPQAASGHETMELWLAGDRRTDDNTVYLEECDFAWFSGADIGAGHPIDDTRGVEHLQLYSCRIHNESSRASIAVGGGTVDVHLTELSGMAQSIKQTGGFFGTKQIRGGSGVIADSRPPIPEPPAPGETPISPKAGSVRVGRPGGSTGRFYGR